MVQPDVAGRIAADKNFGFGPESRCEVEADRTYWIPVFIRLQCGMGSGFLARITGWLAHGRFPSAGFTGSAFSAGFTMPNSVFRAWDKMPVR